MSIFNFVDWLGLKLSGVSSMLCLPVLFAWLLSAYPL